MLMCGYIVHDTLGLGLWRNLRMCSYSCTTR